MNDINFTMYKLAGIIAEYDPFHNGHAWQLQQAKALGAQRVAVAMSCGLTQRGALPLLPESVRVLALAGCDIVACPAALPPHWKELVPSICAIVQVGGSGLVW